MRRLKAIIFQRKDIDDSFFLYEKVNIMLPLAIKGNYTKETSKVAKEIVYKIRLIIRSVTQDDICKLDKYSYSLWDLPTYKSVTGKQNKAKEFPTCVRQLLKLKT